jgi:dihydrofolate reductase
VRIVLVAAVARGGVIGRAGTVPWRLPEDLAHFRQLTIGHPVVMGRKTWDSLPQGFRPLPGRRNIVVTRNAAWHGEGAERAGSLDDALRLVDDAERVFVVGGGELYASALPLADELLLTEIDAETEGDTFFPSWEGMSFEEVSREHNTSETGIPFSFVTYVRRQPAPPSRGHDDFVESVSNTDSVKGTP